MEAQQLNLRTTAQVIRRSGRYFLGAPLLFLLLALLPFSFRHAVDSGANFLSAYLDGRDPSLRSLLSRLSSDADSAPLHRPTQTHPHRLRHRRRSRHRPFLQLTRVGTLDDDFFSDDEELDRSPFASARHGRASHSNGSFAASYPLPDPALGVRVREIAGPPGFIFLAEDGDGAAADAGEGDDLRLWGLDLDRGDATELLFLLSLLSTAYGWVILGFLFTYCFVLGIVFLAVVNAILQRNHRSSGDNIRAGCRLGLRRLLGFALLRWAVRDAFTQFLGIWFFSDVQDQYLVFKLFLQLKLMPFSVASSAPWIASSSFDIDLSGFIFTWVIIDTFISLMFSVNCWVTIVDSRRGGQEIVREGCYLISIMFNQAFRIKCLESIFCGAFTRWAISQVAGNVFALYVQSLAEVFFMVVWLVFFLAARATDAELGGRRFGRRDLEEYIGGLR